MRQLEVLLERLPNSRVLRGVHITQALRFVDRQRLLLHEDAGVSILLLLCASAHQVNPFLGFLLKLKDSVCDLLFDIYRLSFLERLSAEEALFIECVANFGVSGN